MLRSMKDLQGYAIHATDGNIGHVQDFYFDDEAWVIRYLIVETGTWLSSRKVLISPAAIGAPDWAKKVLPVSITKEQVKGSPDIDTAKPVSRQHETEYLSYYGYQVYWTGTGLWDSVPYPSMSGLGVPGMIPARQGEAAQARDEDHHLRSCEAITGYHIRATDGEIGHVQGLIVDDETWAIRYLVVDTSDWWLGHRVLVAPQWIRDISWSEMTVILDLTRQEVRDAPAYDSAAQLDREQEASIHEHYGRPGYWATEAKAVGKREAAISRP